MMIQHEQEETGLTVHVHPEFEQRAIKIFGVLGMTIRVEPLLTDPDTWWVESSGDE